MQNATAMNQSINTGKSWGSKAFLNFGVSVSNQGASQLARHTAALYLANAVLGYKVNAFAYVYIGMIASTITNGFLTNFGE